MTQRDQRILVLAPYGENATLIAAALLDSGMESHLVKDAEDLKASLRQGAGAVVIEQQAVDAKTVEVLTDVVESQPPWSDIPIIILTEGASSALIGRLSSANLSVLERPIRPQTLIAAVRFALRARERQYEIRDHLSELKRAEAEIQELNQTLRRRNAELDAERARWQGVVEGIADEVWVCNAQGEMSLVNLATVTAMRLQAFTDRPVTDILAEVDISYPDGTPRPPGESPLLRSLRGEVVRGEEVMQHRGTGTRRYRQFSSAPTRDATGEITGAVAIVRDVTDHKLAEEALRQSEERFRALVSTSSEVVYRMSPDWKEMRYLGGGGFLAGTEISSREWLQQYIPPDDQPEVWTAIQKAIREKSLFQLEHRVRRPNGSLGWTLSRAVPILDANGEIAEWFGAASDVTARKQAQEALHESESRFRLFMDNSPALAWIKDEQGRYVYFSRTFEDRFRVRLEDWRGKTDEEFWPDEASLLRANDLAVLASNRAMEVIEETSNPDGTKATWLNSKFPIISSTTGQRFVAGIGVDITERKRAEQALIRSEKLAVTGRMAATIAHEINNPLAAATNAVYLASSDPNVAPQTRDVLLLADQELRRAAHITQQTLGFFRENANPVPIALPKLINEVLGVYARKLKDRGVTVHCRYSCGPCREGCETCFQVNAGEMRQIISNLLGNGIDAIRDNGKLYIRVSRVTSLSASGQEIHLTMADNGCGIRAEHLKRIFEPFFTTKESVGTGLGLWVTQELVRKHNGSIRVRSSKGKGTVFQISVPTTPVTLGGSRKMGNAVTSRSSAWSKSGHL